MARLQQITAVRGNRLLLGLAVAAGAVAAILVFVALSSSNDGGKVSTGGSSSVAVATQDINPGTLITSDMVKLVGIQQDQLISGAVTDTSTAVGQAARVKIYKGEQLATGKVGAENKTEGISGVVQPGMRGFAVGVDQVRAAGGLMRPGNHVDVYIAQVLSNNQADRNDDTVVSRLLLQDIEVLAVAQQAQQSAPAQANPSSGDTTTSGTVPDNIKEQPNASTVTLSVTPEQAAILVCAQEDPKNGGNGSQKIWLSLRGYAEPKAAEHTVFSTCQP